MTFNKIIQELTLCFVLNKKNIDEGFCGFLSLNEDLLFPSNVEVFDLIFCELYFKDSIAKKYLNGSPKGDICFPLSNLFTYKQLYPINELSLSSMYIEKLATIISIQNLEKPIESIFISDRLEDGSTEYIDFEINNLTL